MQNLEHTGWKLQRTIAGGALELAGGIGMIDPLALALDMEHALSVDVCPTEAESFPASQAADQHEQEQGIAGYLLGGGEIAA